MRAFRSAENGVISDGLFKKRLEKEKVLSPSKKICFDNYKAKQKVKDGIVSAREEKDEIIVNVAFSKKIVSVAKNPSQHYIMNDEQRNAYNELIKDIERLNLLISDIEVELLAKAGRIFMDIISEDYYPLTNTYSRREKKGYDGGFQYSVCHGRSLCHLDLTVNKNIYQRAYEAVCCFLSSPNNSHLRFTVEYGKLENYYSSLNRNILVCYYELALHYLSEIDFYKILKRNSTMTDMFELACEHIQKAHPEIYDHARLLFLNEK